MTASDRAAAGVAKDLLIQLCEQARAEISGAALVDAFAEAGRVLLDWGALKPAGNLATVTCRACADQHFAEVEFEPQTRTYRHFCVEAGWVEVPESDLRRYALSLDWLLDRLATLVGVRDPQPSNLVRDVAWRLGEARIGDCDWTALLGRRLGDERNLDLLTAALAERTWPGPALVLTTSDSIGTWLKLPRGFRTLALPEVMSAESDGFHLDYRAIIAAIATAAGPSPTRTGMAGRPSAKHLYFAEHSRRLASGEAQTSLADEARALSEWMRDVHPTVPRGAVRTIENNIRAQHRTWIARARN
jgi:hypothetical protein